jgi:hypothetical protein
MAGIAGPRLLRRRLAGVGGLGRFGLGIGLPGLHLALLQHRFHRRAGAGAGALMLLVLVGWAVFAGAGAREVLAHDAWLPG